MQTKKCVFCGSEEVARREACSPCLQEEQVQEEEIADFDARAAELDS